MSSAKLTSLELGEMLTNNIFNYLDQMSEILDDNY